MRTLAHVAAALSIALALCACGSDGSQWAPITLRLGPPASDEPLKIGDAAVDTYGGWLPDGTTLSPFDVSHPVVGLLDPALLEAIQEAARKAATERIDIQITSGWRSKGFQQRLFDGGVRTYGSIEKAREFVASPDRSEHVEGKAVDIAPVDADRWLIRNGAQFGLCQIFANEIWHFELAADDQGRCPPLRPNAAG